MIWRFTLAANDKPTAEELAAGGAFGEIQLPAHLVLVDAAGEAVHVQIDPEGRILH